MCRASADASPIRPSPLIASKFAVEGFSESLAFEASLFDVDVVLVEPGPYKTEIFDPIGASPTRAPIPARPILRCVPRLMFASPLWSSATRAIRKKLPM